MPTISHPSDHSAFASEEAMHLASEATPRNLPSEPNTSHPFSAPYLHTAPIAPAAGAPAATKQPRERRQRRRQATQMARADIMVIGDTAADLADVVIAPASRTVRKRQQGKTASRTNLRSDRAGQHVSQGGINPDQLDGLLRSQGAQDGAHRAPDERSVTTSSQQAELGTARLDLPVSTTMSASLDAAEQGSVHDTAPLPTGNETHETQEQERAQEGKHGKTRKNTGEKSQHATRRERAQRGSHEEAQVDMLTRLSHGAKWVKTPDGELYARVPVNGHAEVIPLNDKGLAFRRWLLAQYYHETHLAASSAAVLRVVETCIAWAAYEATQAEAHVRLAAGEGGALFLDLANDAWEVVQITPTGWSILPEAPALFRRARSLRSLPTPQRCDTRAGLERLKTYVNVASEADWHLAVGWLLGVFHPSGPYPLLAISGAQGAAKSTATRYLRNVVDPVTAPLRESPRSSHDLVIAAKNNHILAFDNLSSIPAWLSDALCRMATESGYATRLLYSNDEESVFDARRPVIVNGISDLIERGDLADRAIALMLADILPEQRKAEEELARCWQRDHPVILGALLDVVSAILRERASVRLPTRPRMADFVSWVTAAEACLGWERHSFVRLFAQRQTEAVNVQLDSSLVAQELLCFLSGTRAIWSGTASELLSALSDSVRAKTGTIPRDWPKTPLTLSNELRRLGPALGTRGISVASTRTNKKRLLELTRVPE